MQETLDIKIKYNKITTSKTHYESGFLYFYLDNNDKIIYIFNALNCHILKYKNTDLKEFKITEDNIKVYYNISLSEVFNDFAKENIKLIDKTIISAKSELERIKENNKILNNDFLEYLI